MSEQPNALQVLAQIAEGVGAQQEALKPIADRLTAIERRTEAAERAVSDHRLQMAPFIENAATVGAILSADAERLERENAAAALQTSRLQAAGDSVKELLASKWGTLFYVVAAAAAARWYPEILAVLFPGQTP